MESSAQISNVLNRIKLKQANMKQTKKKKNEPFLFLSFLFFVLFFFLIVCLITRPTKLLVLKSNRV